MRIKFLFLVILLANIQYSNAQSPQNKKPNIIFFLVDDMGWMDCSVYGSKYYETPNIERLAKEGMLFTNAYTANPLCSPTRASILSGQYPERFHLTTPSGHLKPNPDEVLMKDRGAPWQKMITPGSRHFMPLEEFTIAESLKENGYTTGFLGKWHVGQDPYNPENQGFDYNIAGGPNPGPPNYFSPYHIKNLPDGPPHEYITDRLTNEALKYLEMKKDTSFFLCLWHFAVHAPYQGKLPIVKKYEDKVDPRGKQDNPIMAAMIESMDQSLGKVMDKLEELKIVDNTIIIFTSDNGGNMYDIVNGKNATNNYPLKFGKGNIHEGGIKVPAIVVWPGKVKPGSVSDEVISSIDFYPTIQNMTGTPASKQQQLDGVDISPVLTGKEKKLDREAIYCYFPHYTPATSNLPSSSVRKGDWKLICVYGEGKNRTNAYELYNLKKDIGEQLNLADRYHKKVKELDKLIQKHVAHVGCEDYIPVKNPVFNPDAKSPMGIRPVFPTEKYPMF